MHHLCIVLCQHYWWYCCCHNCQHSAHRRRMRKQVAASRLSCCVMRRHSHTYVCVCVCCISCQLQKWACCYSLLLCTNLLCFRSVVVCAISDYFCVLLLLVLCRLRYVTDIILSPWGYLFYGFDAHSESILFSIYQLYCFCCCFCHYF